MTNAPNRALQPTTRPRHAFDVLVLASVICQLPLAHAGAVAELGLIASVLATDPYVGLSLSR